MAEETKTQAEKDSKKTTGKKNPENKKAEREYIIPLRRAWLNVPSYERTGKAIKAIKKFIAKHMRVIDRDVSKVKLDVYFNNEIWFRGRANPPAKVKVKATKEGEIVKVDLVDIPEHVKFLKARHEKIRKLAESDKKESKAEKPEVKQEEKTDEQKKDEKEKAQATAIQNEEQAEQQSKAQKHIGKLDKKKTQPQRMALQK